MPVCRASTLLAYEGHLAAHHDCLLLSRSRSSDALMLSRLVCCIACLALVAEGKARDVAVRDARRRVACAHIDADPRAQTLDLFRDVLLNRVYNSHPGIMDGATWPPGVNALSMAGQRRLDSFAALVATAVCSVKRPSGAACILPTVFMAFPSRMRTHKQAAHHPWP